MINRAVIQVLKLRNVSIFDQLVLEEALFRVDGRNWFIWNQDTAPTAIVMGISGKPEKLVHMDRAQQDEIPLIKRFSGGGTVIVDENTIFTTFILDRASVPDVKPYPREIMDWSGRFFQPVFDRLCPENVAFHLREDDYAFGELKVGGNAQSMWLLNTRQYNTNLDRYLTRTLASSHFISMGFQARKYGISAIASTST